MYLVSPTLVLGTNKQTETNLKNTKITVFIFARPTRFSYVNYRSRGAPPDFTRWKSKTWRPCTPRFYDLPPCAFGKDFKNNFGLWTWLVNFSNLLIKKTFYQVLQDAWKLTPYFRNKTGLQMHTFKFCFNIINDVFRYYGHHEKNT